MYLDTWYKILFVSNTYLDYLRYFPALIVGASCFYWLSQLRRSGRSLDAESAATLVHALVASRVDYCNAVLAGAPKVSTDKLHRVLNAATSVWSAARTSLTVACRGFCTPSYTGLMYLSESHPIQTWPLRTAACMAKLHSIWWISAIRPLASHHGNNFDLTADNSWSFHVAG